MHKNRSAPCPFSETRMDERARCQPPWEGTTDLKFTFCHLQSSKQRTARSTQAQAKQCGSSLVLWERSTHGFMRQI